MCWIVVPLYFSRVFLIIVARFVVVRSRAIFSSLVLVKFYTFSQKGQHNM